MKILLPVFLVFLFTFSLTTAIAKREVKISTIGAVAPQLDLKQEPQQLVTEMIAFWEKELASVLPDKPDLIVLPEVCDQPAEMSTELHLKYIAGKGKRFMEYLSSVAAEHKCYIAFGTDHQLDDGSLRNSCFILDRKGEVAGVYNKNFPTIGEMEAGIKAGKETPVFELDFGRVASAICFDLNFSELRDQYAAKKPEIMLFPSLYHGGLVQQQWAYACRSYFVGSVGIESLPSEVRNPMGTVVASSTNYFHFTTATVNLDYALAHLDYNWAKLRALKEKYGDAVTISDPGEVGSVLLTSEHETKSIDEMVREFDILLLDDYLEKAREFRTKPGMMEE